MMRTAELRQQRSSLTVTWDRHVGVAVYPATADAPDRSVRPKIASGYDAVRCAPVSQPPRRGLPLANHRSFTLSLRAR
jgi:hypothetical protein